MHIIQSILSIIFREQMQEVVNHLMHKNIPLEDASTAIKSYRNQ